MKRVYPAVDWPETWKYSYAYDLLELYGASSNLGYSYSYDARRRQTLRLVVEAVAPPARILDVAAAQGNFSLTLAEMGYDVTWNDLRQDLAGYVRLKHEKGLLSFAPGNVFELSFPALFDAVLITEIIEHVAHPDKFLESIAKLVKPGGVVIVTTPNGAYVRNKLPKFSDCADPSVFETVQFRPNSDGHIFLLHPEELTLLAHRAGLLTETTCLFNSPLTNGHLKLAPLLRLLPSRAVHVLEEWMTHIPHSLRRKLSIHMAARLRKPVSRSS